MRPRCILLEQELTSEVKHVKKPKTLAGPRVTRRTVIASASLIPLAAIQGAPQSAKSAAPAAALSPEQRRILEAFIDRLVPKDELGPGAVECGAAEYIDRSLADYLVNEKPVFTQGLAAVDAYARSPHGGPFADLSAEKRDAVLTAIDTGQAPNLRGFFNRARRLTLEGMFGDPSYGGNKDFAGWDLIRYPGAKMAVGPEDQSMKTPPKPYRKALYGVDHGH
jgi:gluconate 2-dehydrogenase gamma chain